MQKFEDVFGDLDVKTSVLSDGLASTTATAAPSSEVEALMKELIEENNLDIDLELNKIKVPSGGLTDDLVTDLGKEAENDLQDRLKLLRE